MSTMTPAAAPRDFTLDVAKGLAIISVVFVHVWRGAEAAGLIADQVLFSAVDTAFCLWVLTLFAFVAGLFIERGMRRDGAGVYTRRRVGEFVWLYVVWSLLNNLSNLVGSQLANTPVTLEQSLSLWSPRAQMWYLGWMSVMLIGTAVARPWQSRRRMVLTLAVVTALSALCWGLNGPVLGTLGLGISIAFFVGVVVRSDRALALLNGVSLPVHLIVGLLALTVAFTVTALVPVTPPTHGGESRNALTVALALVVSALSSVAALQLCRLVAHTPLRRPLAYLGRASMVVFLGHLLFTPTARIVLMHLGVTDLATQVVAGTVAGVGGPVLMSIAASRLGMPWLFAAPSFRRSPRSVGRVRDTAAASPTVR